MRKQRGSTEAILPHASPNAERKKTQQRNSPKQEIFEEHYEDRIGDEPQNYSEDNDYATQETPQDNIETINNDKPKEGNETKVETKPQKKHFSLLRRGRKNTQQEPQTIEKENPKEQDKDKDKDKDKAKESSNEPEIEDNEGFKKNESDSDEKTDAHR